MHDIEYTQITILHFGVQVPIESPLSHLFGNKLHLSFKHLVQAVKLSTYANHLGQNYIEKY